MSRESVTALITGASGFAGRHLIAELEARTDWLLIGIGRSAVTAGQRTRVLSCDLMDADLVRRVTLRRRPDVVFHLAAESYVPRSLSDPATTLTNNIVGQLNVLEACRANGLSPRILIVGSADQYGLAGESEMPLVEDQPFRPLNPYAVSKIAQDMLGLQYALSYDMHIVRVRPFNHFGPGQSDRFAISSFARQIAEAELGRVEPVVLTGNLEARRDFLDVRDVARAYRLALEHGVAGDVYNIAGGRAHRVGDLLEALVRDASIPIEIRQDPARMRPSDTPVLVGNASKLRQATGWQPTIPIDVTLRDTLRDWR
ncbi:MAG TPA: GDP-mannose 4,6-dehydratase, partial [Thermomicrobiales bacterium]|nr:GDP-mannose 4,6-dehydratase [Thermomicrobiales bacterium]